MSASVRKPVVLAAGLTLLQALDLLLTRLLLGGWRHADVYEANPVAEGLLARHGWGALAAFKLGCSLVAIACALAVWRFRPATGVRLLVVMCLAMAGVVGYSTALLARPPHEEPPEVARAVDNARRLDEGRVRSRLFHVWRRDACRALLEGRLTLAEAVEQMGHHLAALRGDRPGPGRLRFPGWDDPADRAAYLIASALRMTHLDPTLPTGRLEGLFGECAERFGRVVAFDPTLPPQPGR